MNKATHVEILGVQIPLRGLEFVTCMPRNQFYDAVVDRMVADGWKEVIDSLKVPTVFERIAERSSSRLPMHAGVNRQLFTYSTLTKPTPDLKPWE